MCAGMPRAAAEEDIAQPTSYAFDEPAAHCPANPGIATVPIDLQAAITVINRRDPAIPDLRRIDLSHSCLNRINLGVRLHGLNLSDSDLSGSDFEDPVTAENPSGNHQNFEAKVDLSDADLTLSEFEQLDGFRQVYRLEEGSFTLGEP